MTSIRVRRAKITRLRIAGVALAVGLIAAAPGPAAGQGTQSARHLIGGFIEAFNSGDVSRMLAFYEQSATEEFRSRRGDAEDRAMYQRLWNDMGPLTQQSLRRETAERVRLVASSEKIPMPVTFEFTLENGLIAGFSVMIGGPPGGENGAEPALDLPDGVDDDALASALDRQLSERARDGSFSGVVLVARDGRPVFHRAYGLANREKEIPNSTRTRFDIGSITKLVTKVAIGRLLQDGTVRLDDTILDHVPDYPDRQIAARITIDQLLSHRSGLGDIFTERWSEADKSALIGPRDFFPLFAGTPLQFEPGEGQAYSNAGYVVLGAIVESASETPYHEFVARHVFKPAGMRRSGFPLRDGREAGLAVGYTTEGGGPRPNLGMLPIRGCPAGSSAHTAEDLLKLDTALRRGDVLAPGWARWVYTDTAPRGDGTEPGQDGELVAGSIGVAGGGPGVNAVLESDGHTTVVVLANLDPPVASELGQQLFRRYSDSP